MIQKRRLFFGIYFFLFFLSHLPPVCAGKQNQVARCVDQIQQDLAGGKKAENVFQFQPGSLFPNQVKAQVLDPSKWIPNNEEANHYIGTLAYVRITAPFQKVLDAANAYDDEAKFTPGIVSAKIVKKKPVSPQEDILIIEREREIPLAIKTLVPGSASYRNENRLIKNKNSMFVRIKLDSTKGGYLKDLEALEYYQEAPNGQTDVFLIGFALPSASFIAAKPEQKQDSNPLMGALNKVVSVIDVRDNLYMEISKAIVEGTYQTAASLVQVTTDPRWKNKRISELTEEDKKQILDENHALLEKAKVTNTIKYDF